MKQVEMLSHLQKSSAASQARFHSAVERFHVERIREQEQKTSHQLPRSPRLPQLDPSNVTQYDGRTSFHEDDTDSSAIATEEIPCGIPSRRAPQTSQGRMYVPSGRSRGHDK